MIEIYRCDPNKNVECKKTGCYKNGGCCQYTKNKKYRMNKFKIIKEGLWNYLKKNF